MRTHQAPECWLSLSVRGGKNREAILVRFPSEMHDMHTATGLEHRLIARLVLRACLSIEETEHLYGTYQLPSDLVGFNAHLETPTISNIFCEQFYKPSMCSLESSLCLSKFQAGFSNE